MSKKVPLLYFCGCCRTCKYRNTAKSLFDASNVLDCVNVNDVDIKPVLPLILSNISWCKCKKEK